MENVDFGGKLKKLREQAGLTQRQLAEKVGINYSYLSKIESGTFQPPSRELILKLAQVLKADSDELLTLAGKVPLDIAKILKNRNVLRSVRDGGSEKLNSAGKDNRKDSFGKRLKELREKAGFSQGELASRVGINSSYLSKIENGSKPAPSEKVILSLAGALNCDKDELMVLAGKVPADITRMLKDRRVRQSIRESQKKNIFDMIEGVGIMRQLMNGALARVALALILVTVTAGALWFSSPSSVRAVDFQFTDPAGGALQQATSGQTYHFKVTVSLADIDRVPINRINMTISSTTNPSYTANLQSLPWANGSTANYTSLQTGGGTANVTITSLLTKYKDNPGYVTWRGTGYSVANLPHGYSYGGSAPPGPPGFITYDVLWTPPGSWPGGTYRVDATVDTGERAFTKSANFAMTGAGLMAETAMAQALTTVSPNLAVVLKVNVDRVKNTTTGENASIGGGLGSYAATATANSTSAIWFMKVNGATPYITPTYDNVTSPGVVTFGVNSLSPAQQASNSTVAEIVPILSGNTYTAITLNLAFTGIASVNEPATNIPEEASHTLTFRRGDATGDGLVNISDALAIAQYRVGKRTLSQINALNAASVVHDGTDGDKITISDALAIAQFRVGKRDAYFR